VIQWVRWREIEGKGDICCLLIKQWLQKVF
jgi:hypothetical protein